MNQATIVIRHFGHLFLFRRKPQDLPYSTKILTWLVLGSFAAVWLNQNLPNINNLKLIVFGLQDILFLASLYVFLMLFKLPNRFIQTACNFTGLSIVHQLINTVVTLETPFLYLPIVAWILVLKIYITQHAFNSNRIKAFLILLGMEILSISFLILLMNMLYPDGALPTAFSQGAST